MVQINMNLNVLENRRANIGDYDYLKSLNLSTYKRPVIQKTMKFCADDKIKGFKVHVFVFNF